MLAAANTSPAISDGVVVVHGLLAERGAARVPDGGTLEMLVIDRGEALRKLSGEYMKSEVDEYLARVPEPARSTLNRIREVIRSVVPPEATERSG